MADSTSTRNKKRGAATEEDTGTVRIFLRRSVGLRDGALYGPGWADVPRKLADAIQHSPDFVETDSTGRPLPTTTAASALGPRGGGSSSAVPVPERDEEGDHIDADAAPPTPFSREREAIAEAAENDERTGGQTLAESGSHLDEGAELHPQPGQKSASREQRALTQREEQARRARARRGDPDAEFDDGGTDRAARGVGDEEEDTDTKPATKTALRERSADELRELAQRKNVPITDDDNKDDVIDKLYDARVSLDD